MSKQYKSISCKRWMDEITDCWKALQYLLLYIFSSSSQTSGFSFDIC